MPWYTSESDKHLQVFLGDRFINSLTYSIFQANPGLGFPVNSGTLDTPFDIATLNFVLPGLLQHYGMVNKEMTMWCEITEVTIFEYLP